MRHADFGDLEEDDGIEDDGLDGDGLDGDAEVTCPYCGESMSIAIDPTGGAEQSYVEDCQVCCQPWQVHVHVRDGHPDVHVEALG